MSSPLKFLDAYGAQDQAIFFGRTEEVDQLYRLIFQTDLLLVYGASGTGKTSLVQCGLAGRFKPTDRFELLVRRKDDLNASLDREIRRAALTPIAEGVPLADAVQSLYLDHLRPVHLIFDQFEEIFVLGSKDEQRIFIDGVAALLARQVACKVIIVMREEFIAMLYEFEKTIPRLFAKRFRVEPMSLQNVTRVITGTAEACGITLEQGETTAQHIIENLSDHRAGVQLSYLQVYLDKLYREAVRGRPSSSGPETPIVFSERLVSETGALDDVLASFLEEQTTDIQQQLTGADPKVRSDAVQLVLEEFTSLEGTKQPMARAELARRLPEVGSVLDPCLAALARSRVVRQSEGVYELSHDALARRIADNRSAERKTLLKVQKIVKDRVSGYEQTKTLLSKEELALATPYLAKLGLTESEAKFVTKSRWRVRRRLLFALAGTAAVAVVILAFAVATSVENERAENTIRAARQVVDELMATVEGRLASIPNEAVREARRELLAIASRLNEQLNQEAQSTEAVAAGTTFWAEKVAGDLAMDQEDLDAAQAHYGKAMETAQGLVQANPDDTDWQRNLAIGHRILGDVAVRKGDPEAARKHFATAIELAERLTQSKPDDLDWQRDLLIYQGLAGQVELAAGQVAPARQAYDKALTIADRMAKANPADLDLQRNLAFAYGQLGDLEAAENQAETAREWFAKALVIAKNLVDSDPKNVAWRQDLASYLSRLGGLERAAGRAEPARQALTAAVQIESDLVQADPQNRIWLRGLWVDARQLGTVESSDGTFEAARDAFAQALQAATALAEADPTNRLWQRDLSTAHVDFSSMMSRGGQHETARLGVARAMEIADALVAAEPDDRDLQQHLSFVASRRGEIELAAGQRDAARQAYTKDLALSEELARADPANHGWQQGLSIAYRQLGDVDAAEGKREAARAWYAKAVTVAERLVKDDPGTSQWQDDVRAYRKALADLDRGRRK